MENRIPKFPLNIDEESKDYLWKYLLLDHEDVEFYELPEARPILQLFDRFKYTDPETDAVIEQVMYLYMTDTVIET